MHHFYGSGNEIHTVGSNDDQSIELTQYFVCHVTIVTLHWTVT